MHSIPGRGTGKSQGFEAGRSSACSGEGGRMRGRQGPACINCCGLGLGIRWF